MREHEACSSNSATGVTYSVVLSPVLPLLIWVPCVIGCVMWSRAECADSSIWGPSRARRQRFSEFSGTIITVFSFQSSVWHKYLGQSLTLTVVMLFLCVKLHWRFVQLNILTLKALQCSLVSVTCQKCQIMGRWTIVTIFKHYLVSLQWGASFPWTLSYFTPCGLQTCHSFCPV